MEGLRRNIVLMTAKILFLEFPAMYRCGDHKDPFYNGILHKAVVYVEDVD